MEGAGQRRAALIMHFTPVVKPPRVVSTGFGCLGEGVLRARFHNAPPCARKLKALCNLGWETATSQ
jgi:hypothetical protein